VLGCLALPRMLAAHAALAPLQGNPKAIALAVSLLQRGETGKTRPLAEVAALLGRDLDKGDCMADVPDACRATLERLHELLRPASPSPSPSPTPTPTPSPTPLGSRAGADAPPPDEAQGEREQSEWGAEPSIAPPGRAAAEKASKLPAGLLLRSAELGAMCTRTDGRESPWLGSGSIGS
jgi:hypothetical protein